MKYKYNQKKTNPKTISLHDSFCTKIINKKNSVHFIFDDGFWIIETNKENKSGKTLRSDRSKMIISGYPLYKNIDLKDDYYQIYIFEKIEILKKVLFTIRKEISLKKFINLINKKKYSYEFVYEYYNFNSVLFKGYLYEYKKKLPKIIECWMYIDFFTDIEYKWNNIDNNRMF